MIGLLLASSAWADCVGMPTNNASLQRQVESAYFSFVELDDTGFEAYRKSAVDSVFCLEELVHPHLAAEFLRLEGVRAFTAGEEGFASAAFRAAQTLEPAHRLPTTLAPPGGPLHTLYTGAATLPVIPWDLPQGGFRTYVNGIPSSTAPNGIAIVQIVRNDGTLAFSGIVTRREDLPPPLLAELARLREDPVVPSPQPIGVAPVPVPVPVEPDPDRGSRVPAVVGTAVCALAAGALFGGSAWSRLRYDAAPTAARRKQTNAMFLGSVGTGAITVGVGIAAVIGPRKKK